MVFRASTFRSRRSDHLTRSVYRAPWVSAVAISFALGTFATDACATDIAVGPTRTIQTLAGGVAAARSGDRVLLDPGTYVDDTAIVTVPMTIEGAGPGVVLQITQPIPNQKGILVVDATLTVRNITFLGAQVTAASGGNGAGIRMERGDLTVDSCVFQNNQDGMLVNPNAAATITVTNSQFIGNGAGDGYTHGMYVNEVGQLTVTNSSFVGTKLGHSIKSRALRTTVSNVDIDDGVQGTSSYAIDLPNGGVAVIDNVRITQGANSDNPTMIAYGEENGLKASNSLTVTNSSFVNRMSSPYVVAVYNFTSTVTATLTNDTFDNVPTMLRGPGNNSTAAAGVIIRQASIFSSTQATAQSHLRFYNSGTTAGTVKVTLYDGVSGLTLATWQSASIAPNAAPQVPITTIEAAASQPFAKPSFYAIAIQPTFAGSFQHVLYKPSDGTLTNLSACDLGITTNGAKLANVHSSVLDNGFPASIVIYNTGPSATAVTLGIYDARDGSRLGSYPSAPVAAGGQAVISVDTIEAGARITPTASMYHYTMKVESTFTGVLQQLVNNQRVGVITDMTAVCPLSTS